MAIKQVLLIADDGFEDVELVAIIDVLTRVGIKPILAGLHGVSLFGAYGTRLAADAVLSDVLNVLDSYDALVFGGGKKNARSLAADVRVLDVVQKFFRGGKIVGAICASPSHVLAAAGILAGKRVSGDPVFNDKLEAAGAVLTHQGVTVDGNLVTGTGPGTALQFALVFAGAIVGQEGVKDLHEKWSVPPIT
jgi:4-methyl-5(b-hydroxyethyl)-thiazole monophosphate biosynthesis